MVLPSVQVAFPTREVRSQFVHSRFTGYLEGQVLDVGCWAAPLRALLGPTRYTGIDRGGDPDITLDLERMSRLPFDDQRFDSVVCVEVLEHLENLHLVFEELVRVSKRYVIVSLPNCWCDARRPVGRGKGQVGHYGLPLQKPDDRHKWFFNLADARQFVAGNAERLGLRVEQMFVTEKPRNGLVRLARRIRYPGHRYQNRYGGTLWAVLEKANGRAGS